MAANEILPFSGTDTGANLLTQAEYSGDAQRLIGNQPGIARAKLVNKAMRQTSLIAAGVAQYLANNQATNIVDTLTPAQIAEALAAAIPSGAANIANTPAGNIAATTVQGALNELDTEKLAATAVSAFGLTLVGDSNAATARATLGVPSTNALGLRNRIINGGMRIDQRNNGAAVIAVGEVYFLDRFKSGNSSAGGTITVQQSALNGLSSMRVTATAAVTSLAGANYVAGPTQRIEAQNVFDLNNKTVTFSFLVETNWTGNLSVCFNSSNNNRSYVVDVAVVSGTNTAIVVVPFEASTVETNSNGFGVQVVIGSNNEASFSTTTKGAWQAGAFFTSTSSTQWAKTTGNFINVTNVQLEEGSVATPFERRPIGFELTLCQRYLPAFSGGSNTFFGFFFNTTSAFVGCTFPVTARVPPTGVTFSSVSHFNISDVAAANQAATSASLSSAGVSTATLTFSTSAVLTAQRAGYVFANTAAARTLFTGCEL